MRFVIVFLNEYEWMNEWMNILKLWRRRSMRFYLKNNHDKFKPNPFWNDGALDFYRATQSARYLL